jgi:SAM-dependent methyltransferase
MAIRLDYDEIAHLYDEPERDHPVDPNLLAYLRERPAPARLCVLDVGCGTGKQIAANRARWPEALIVGVDRSRRMLAIARARCPAAGWVLADGAVLPFAAARFHYVGSQYSYQHIGRTPALVREVLRVLEPGGRFVMTNIDPWSMSGWLVYTYFPESLAIDQRDFLPAEQFAALMRDSGFVNVHATRADASYVLTHREFMAYAASRHRASQLMAIPDEAYRTGLQRLRRDAEDAPPASTSLRSEFVVVTIAGDKPAAPRPADDGCGPPAVARQWRPRDKPGGRLVARSD